MSTELCAAGHHIEIDDSRVLVDGIEKHLFPAALAILRVLALQPGKVVARDTLMKVLPGRTNKPHAVDTAVLRLRAALGDDQIIRTVVKRGYRLAIDPPEAGDN